MTVNLRIASGARGQVTASESYDALYGRYAETRAPVPYHAETSQPEAAPVLAPPVRDRYMDPVELLPVEVRVGLDAMPRIDALPLFPR